MSTEQASLDSQAFSGKTVIVTGGGYGIGKQIALTFGRLGANVVVAARSRAKLEAVAEELRGMNTDPLALTVDIGIESTVRDMAEAVADKYGGMDVLVNNAAITGPTAIIPDIDPADWRAVVDINLSGTFYCCKHVSKFMLKAGSGNIITISSVAGRTAYPLRAPYAVTRWGVIGLSHTLAAELGPLGIRADRGRSQQPRVCRQGGGGRQRCGGDQTILHKGHSNRSNANRAGGGQLCCVPRI